MADSLNFSRNTNHVSSISNTSEDELLHVLIDCPAQKVFPVGSADWLPASSQLQPVERLPQPRARPLGHFCIPFVNTKMHVFDMRTNWARRALRGWTFWSYRTRGAAGFKSQPWRFWHGFGPAILSLQRRCCVERDTKNKKTTLKTRRALLVFRVVCSSRNKKLLVFRIVWR